MGHPQSQDLIPYLFNNDEQNVLYISGKLLMGSNSYYE